MERIDWTKYLVPRINRNADGYKADFEPDSLNTIDLVTLPSLAELRALNIPFPAATDFARVRGGYDFSQTADLLLLTRTPCSRDAMYCLPDFTSRDVCLTNPSATGLGVTPSISLRLPRHYTLAQLAEQFALTKADNGLFQVQLGEYPQTKVADLPEGNKHNTGRWYTTFIESACGHVSQQNPEYLIQGQRYIHMYDRYVASAWYKVEPLTWWVTNSAAVAKGNAKQLDLICAQMIMGSIPFNQRFTDNYNTTLYSSFWQNSLMRAFLNSADSRTLDGNPAAKLTDSYWDFTQGGFLQQALNMTHEPTREYTVPACERGIVPRAFGYCKELEKLVIPRHVVAIGSEAFANCPNLRLQIELPRKGELVLSPAAFASANFKYLYVPRDPHGQWLWLTPDQDPTLADDYYQTAFDFNFDLKRLNNLLDDNYRQNFLQVSTWRQQGKVKFMPPEFTLQLFPATEMANYFVNNNHKRWAELVKSVHFDLLADQQKLNSLTDLMKIYYALGGFSAHQGERDKAFAYIDQQVAQYRNEGKRPSLSSYIDDILSAVANDIHQRFSRLVLKGPYNPTFAQFFMKYYHTDPDFMRFEFTNRSGQDYLCAAHNNFDELLQKYPNRVVNGNTERDLLTPRFVAEHCCVMHYENVDEQNAALAETVGAYGYTQEQFDRIQNIYNRAKKLKDQAVIRATDKGTVSDVSYRVLEKDDPLGFVIGDITNCCQHIGSVGESCVVDGYTNPNAGFLVFETADGQAADGKATGKKRILGQAYVWYDPATLTVCYDNIEIPSKVLAELRSGEEHHQALSMDALIQTVINSADGIMTAMNHKGTRTPVERVTVGKGYNDLRVAFDQQFTVTSIRAEHRGYSGYTDAKAQYLIRTYEETQAKLTTATVGNNRRGLKIKLPAARNTERER